MARPRPQPRLYAPYSEVTLEEELQFLVRGNFIITTDGSPVFVNVIHHGYEVRVLKAYLRARVVVSEGEIDAFFKQKGLRENDSFTADAMQEFRKRFLDLPKKSPDGWIEKQKALETRIKELTDQLKIIISTPIEKQRGVEGRGTDPKDFKPSRPPRGPVPMTKLEREEALRKVREQLELAKAERAGVKEKLVSEFGIRDAKQWDKKYGRVINEMEQNNFVPPGRYDLFRGVKLNLAAMPVKVYSSSPVVKNGKLGPSLMRNNPAVSVLFAYAFVKFLFALKEAMNLTGIYSAGFMRDPLDTNDVHPMGKSFDLEGLQFGDVDLDQPEGDDTFHLVHLRSGYEFRNPKFNEIADERKDFAHGPSDWFNHRMFIYKGWFPGWPYGDDFISYADVFRFTMEIASVHFAFIMGPGTNAGHMNAIHLEIEPETIDPPSKEKSWPADSDDPTPFIPKDDIMSMPRPERKRRKVPPATTRNPRGS